MNSRESPTTLSKDEKNTDVNPGIEPASPVALAFQADSLLLSHWGSPWMCLAALFVPGELYVKYLYVLLLYDPLSQKSM